MASIAKSEVCSVKKIGPIYPVFAEENVKRNGKVTKRLVLKEKRIWVQWKSAAKTEEWTAEPLGHFSGSSKEKALASIKKGECWPWKEPDRVQALKSMGKLAIQSFFYVIMGLLF